MPVRPARALAALALVLTSGACAKPQRGAMTAPAPQGPAAVVSCATTELNQRGYTITQTTANPPLVVGERSIEQKWTPGEFAAAFMTLGLVRPDHRPMWDVITVSAFETQNATAPLMVRVTPATTLQSDRGRTSGGSLKSGWDDAQAIAGACGQAGAVTLTR